MTPEEQAQRAAEHEAYASHSIQQLTAIIRSKDQRIGELEKESRDVPLCADHAQVWFTHRHFKPGDCWFCQKDARVAELERDNKALREVISRMQCGCLSIDCAKCGPSKDELVDLFHAALLSAEKKGGGE